MSNFEMMRKRLEWQGGIAQEDRMIKDKWRTLLRTLKYSYQACDIALAQAQQEILDEGLEPEYPIVRALINPDKNKQDYDDKILSVDYIHQFKPGDVFEWKNTGTHWIIYLQQLTEDAYFRGEIRRCRYKIKFKDEDGNPIKNKFGYFKNSITWNIKKLNLDIDDLWSYDDLLDLEK